MIVQDLQALSGALSAVHALFQFGTMRIPSPYVAMSRIIPGIVADPASVVARREAVAAELEGLTPTELVGARLLIFGRTGEAFLSRQSLVNNQVLAAAWHNLFTDSSPPKLKNPDDSSRALDDLALLAMTLSWVNYVDAVRFWQVVDSVSNPDGPKIAAYRKMVGELIAAIGDDVLGQVSARLFAEAAPAPDGAAAGMVPARPAAAGGTRVRVAGREVSVDGKGIKVFPVVTEAADREAVRRAEAIRTRAVENMQAAVSGYLRRKIQVEHGAMLNAHVAALISGEIGAPLEEREAAVDFIARSPEHAEAYGLSVLRDAFLGEVLKSPLSVMVGLKDIEVRKGEVVRGGERKATPTRGGAERIGEMSITAYRLGIQYPEVMTALSQENPDAFSSESLRKLGSAADVAQQVGRMSGAGGARIQFLLDAQDTASIPEGFVTRGVDRERVDVSMPEGSPAHSAEWKDPLNSYLNGPEFRTDVEAKPLDSSQIPFHNVAIDIYNTFGHGFQLSFVLTLVDQRKFDEARKRLINIRKTFLQSAIGGLAEDSGLHQMDGFDAVVDRFAAAGDLRQAEALLDFVQSWVTQATALVVQIVAISDRLRIAGEQKARVAFERIANELLLAGDIEGLRRLMGSVKVQLRDLDATAKAKIALLSSKVASALLLVLESARALGALPDGAARAALTARVPAVDELLSASGGPSTPEQVYAKMEGLGIPVPGQPGVAALGTERAGGYLPAAAGQKALPAPAATEAAASTADKGTEAPADGAAS
jgi:hypothetical protein